jgi:DsbC/DsbD-like thiol-disulfide interchange protein
LQHGKDVQPNLIRSVFVNHALRVECFHQSDCSEGEADAFLQDPAPQFIELEAATAQVQYEAGRIDIAQGAEDGDAHEARFFVAGDNLQIDFGLMADSFD